MTNNHEKQLEKLSKAIIKALENSSEIKKILKRLQTENIIHPDTIMVLALKPQPPQEKKKAKRKKSRNANDLITNFLDGQELSPMEINFEEYCRKNFNEKDWLKKLKIKY